MAIKRILKKYKKRGNGVRMEKGYTCNRYGNLALEESRKKMID